MSRPAGSGTSLLKKTDSLPDSTDVARHFSGRAPDTQTLMEYVSPRDVDGRKEHTRGWLARVAIVTLRQRAWCPNTHSVDIPRFPEQ